MIIDYGMGNLSSVANMIHRLGGQAMRASEPCSIAEAEKIILPGVGAFDHGMQAFRQDGWIDALNDAVLRRRVPVLGICLGMQLMCNSSEEGNVAGLGWIDAEVRRFKRPAEQVIKVPHMGWNTVKVINRNPLISGEDGEQRFYFVHSYHAVCNRSEDVLAIAHHGYDFAAAFSHENIFGVQFHPEKSHRFGMALMKRFMELECSSIA